MNDRDLNELKMRLVEKFGSDISLEFSNLEKLPKNAIIMSLPKEPYNKNKQEIHSEIKSYFALKGHNNVAIETIATGTSKDRENYMNNNIEISIIITY